MAEGFKIIRSIKALYSLSFPFPFTTMRTVTPIPYCIVGFMGQGTMSKGVGGQASDLSWKASPWLPNLHNAAPVRATCTFNKCLKQFTVLIRWKPCSQLGSQYFKTAGSNIWRLKQGRLMRIQGTMALKLGSLTPNALPNEM